MNPIIGAGLISAGANIGTSVANTINQNRINSVNYQRYLDSVEQDRAYNSPTNQVRMYKLAGLNPNLIYGNVNFNSQESAGSMPQASAYQMPQGMVSDLASNFATSRQLSQRDKEIAGALRKIDADITQSGYQNSEIVSRINLNEKQYDKLLEDIKNTILQGEGLDLDNQLKEFNLDFLKPQELEKLKNEVSLQAFQLSLSDLLKQQLQNQNKLVGLQITAQEYDNALKEIQVKFQQATDYFQNNHKEIMNDPKLCNGAKAMYMQMISAMQTGQLESLVTRLRDMEMEYADQNILIALIRSYIGIVADLVPFANSFKPTSSAAK